MKNIRILTVYGIFSGMLKIQQANQRILEQPVDRLPAEVLYHEHDDPQPYIESNVVDASHQPIEPDDQVRGWLDQVKHDLRNSDEKDENDKTNH